jgi:acetyl-CoA carboxylase biotin carboxyl carrier protein
MPRRNKSAPDQRADASSEISSTLDVDALRQVVEILEASDVTRLIWRKGNERLLIRRDPALAGPSLASHGHAPVAVVASAPASTSTAASVPTPAKPAESGQVVTSPFVGTFYRSPSPDQPSFVEVGSVVKKGQPLCIIEAMKLMNEIESELSGKVVEILVQNGQPVEFGQALFRLEQA